MAILAFRVSNYALNVYMTGKQRLTARDGYTGVPTSPDNYVPPVMAYAAKNYYLDDIDQALTNGWINQQEHTDTVALKTEADPQYRPTATTSETSGSPEA